MTNWHNLKAVLETLLFCMSQEIGNFMELLHLVPRHDPVVRACLNAIYTFNDIKNELLQILATQLGRYFANA